MSHFKITTLLEKSLAYGHTFFYILCIWALPFYILPTSKALFFVFSYVAGTGVLFGLASQINHLNDSSVRAADRKAEGNGNSNDNNNTACLKRPVLNSWAMRQVETSNNFCPNSRFMFLFFHGLNFQIEHHLLPGVSHEHLPGLAPIIRRTCQEFGVNYKSYDNYSEILGQTLSYYRILSIPDPIPPSSAPAPAPAPAPTLTSTSNATPIPLPFPIPFSLQLTLPPSL